MSRKVNILALPKVPEFWRNIVAPDGWVVASDDIVSLEPHVLTQLSQDKNLMRVYGPGAKQQCIYLLAGYGIFERIKTLYNLDGYDTEEELDAVKGVLGKERKSTKPVYLGWQYGLGAAKLSEDKNIPFSEAKKFLRSIDKMFPGVQILQAVLTREWAANGGYVINGRGRPICVPRDKLKDIVNRVVQSTGVDILNRILYHRKLYIDKHGIQAKPLIPNYHDEINYVILKEDIEKYRQAVEYSFNMVNEELGWEVKIKHGGLGIGKDLSIRCE